MAKRTTPRRPPKTGGPKTKRKPAKRKRN